MKFIGAKKAELQAAFDTALDSAVIDQESIRWVDASMIGVKINGYEQLATVQTATVEGLKAAISRALSEHCKNVALASTIPSKLKA